MQSVFSTSFKKKKKPTTEEKSKLHFSNQKSSSLGILVFLTKKSIHIGRYTEIEK